MTPGAAIYLATGRDLADVAAEWRIIRLPDEPDADLRARLIEHIRALNASRTWEWILT